MKWLNRMRKNNQRYMQTDTVFWRCTVKRHVERREEKNPYPKQKAKGCEEHYERATKMSCEGNYIDGKVVEMCLSCEQKRR